MHIIISYHVYCWLIIFYVCRVIIIVCYVCFFADGPSSVMPKLYSVSIYLIGRSKTIKNSWYGFFRVAVHYYCNVLHTVPVVYDNWLHDCLWNYINVVSRYERVLFSFITSNNYPITADLFTNHDYYNKSSRGIH